MITTIIILFLILIGSLYLITQLTMHFDFEHIVLLIGIIATVILIYSQARSKRWAWAFSSILHSLALGNLGLLFLWTDNYFVSLLTIFIALIGLLRSFAKLDEQEWEEKMKQDTSFDLKTYDAPGANEPVHADAVIAPKPKRSSTRKPTKKKSSPKRKPAKRRTTRRR